MTHPLTDEICQNIADTEDRLFTSIERGNMRAAYDIALNHIEALVDDKLTELYKDAHSTAESIDFFFDEVLEELRPQQ